MGDEARRVILTDSVKVVVYGAIWRAGIAGAVLIVLDRVLS